MDKDEWLTPTEAARRLGVTRTAIRNRIKRGTLPSMSDNHGHPLVKLPRHRAATVPRDTVPAPCRPEVPQPRQDGAEMVPASVMRETIAALQASHREAMALMIERVDRAEIMLDESNAALRQLVEAALRLPEPAEPWWVGLRRLFGSSTKSDLGG